MKLTQNQLEAMIAESIKRQLKEGFGDTIKNGFQKLGRMGNNLYYNGEFKDPNAIQNPLESFFYKNGWKIEKIAKNTYRCQSMSGLGGNIEKLVPKEKLVATLQNRFPNYVFTATPDTEYTQNEFGVKANNGRVDYDYGEYSESFILKIGRKQMSANGRQEL